MVFILIEQVYAEQMKLNEFPNEEQVPLDFETKKRADFILKRLGLTWEELEGKNVLDVGAGSAEFGQVAQARGISVFSFDLHPYWDETLDEAQRRGINTYSPDSTEVVEEILREMDIKGGAKPVPYVRGNAYHLPFADESFDYVLAHAGPPVTWSRTKREQEEVLSEMKRVLQPGGTIRLSPALSEDALEKKFTELNKQSDLDPGEIATFYEYQK